MSPARDNAASQAHGGGQLGGPGSTPSMPRRFGKLPVEWSRGETLRICAWLPITASGPAWYGRRPCRGRCDLLGRVGRPSWWAAIQAGPGCRSCRSSTLPAAPEVADVGHAGTDEDFRPILSPQLGQQLDVVPGDVGQARIGSVASARSISITAYWRQRGL